MVNYKKEAAKAALGFIKEGHTIGLGAGSTVAHLIDLVRENHELSEKVTFVSSSFKTNNYLLEKGLKVQSPLLIKKLDLYFDGCDQFDLQLNALKSGGGIHTAEKILAGMSGEFILMGDEEKSVPKLNAVYPLVIEILPLALQLVLARLAAEFPAAEIKLRMSNQKDGALISENGNFLADIHFTELPDLQDLNIRVKMIPGIVEHSLFYKMADKAIIAGENGVRIIGATGW
jgi:ribose 5-phosphate isomerase A